MGNPEQMIGLSWRAGLQAPESSLSFGWPFSLSLSLPPKVLLQGTLASGTLFFFLRSRRWVHFTFLGKPFYFLFSFRLAIYSLLDLGSCSTVPFRRVDRSLTRQSLIPVYWTWPIVQRDTETAAQQGWNNPALLTETKPESLSMVNKYGKSLFFRSFYLLQDSNLRIWYNAKPASRFTVFFFPSLYLSISRLVLLSQPAIGLGCVFGKHENLGPAAARFLSLVLCSGV